MLNSDMALLRALAPDAAGREPTCAHQASGCAESSTAAAVRRLAATPSAFLPEFEPVFNRMAARGAASLQALVPASPG